MWCPLLILSSVLSANCNSHFESWEVYCGDEFRCKDINNTICETQCNIDESCQNFEMLELKNEERQYMLDLHNYFRNRLALGEETRGGNSEASNMNVLNWHEELEYRAGCYVRWCALEETDRCTTLKAFKSAGQNVFVFKWKTEHVNYKAMRWLKQAVFSWYEEILYFKKSKIGSYTATGTKRQISRFVQLIWAATTHVGCSRSFSTENETDQMVSIKNVNIACYYGPRGNVELEKIYKVGDPASQCATNANVGKLSEYPGLCGSPVRISKIRHPVSSTNRLSLKLCIFYCYMLLAARRQLDFLLHENVKFIIRFF